MSAAVHLHARLTTQVTEATTTYTVKQTVTAAELAAAGFAANDEVLVIWYSKLSKPTTSGQSRCRLSYNGTELSGSTNVAQFGNATSERAFTSIHRTSLGATIADFEILLAASIGTAALEKSELTIIRLSDFGTENTDWFWNYSSTTVADTTTFSSTNRAVITWTPGSVEDWVYLARARHDITAVTSNRESQTTLDGTPDAGGSSMEGENAGEWLDNFWFNTLPSLSAASHTLAVETRNDSATANNHVHSALLVFKKSKWTDIYTDLAGTVAVATASDVQVATITNTLSATQDLVVLGVGKMPTVNISISGFMWVRQGGSTIIDPQGDTTAALAAGFSYDTTDIIALTHHAYLASQSGALDLDLFASHDAGASRDLQQTKFMVWGMELAGGAPSGDTSPFEGFVSVGADDGKSYTDGTFRDTETVVHVGYGASGVIASVWLRFPNVTIPQGSTVTAAYLDVVAETGVGVTGLLSNIYANAADDATAPTTQAIHAAKVRTSAFTAFDGPSVWTVGTTYTLPDISSAIQEVVSRAGWASGNALMILWDDDGSAAIDHYVGVAAEEHATYAPVLLHVDWVAVRYPERTKMGVGT